MGKKARKAAKAQEAPKPVAAPRRVRAKYDAVQPSSRNERHFMLSDELSANEANSPDVRRKLRRFARYEVANNSYAKGIVLTLANEWIGRGPRLQMRLTERRDANRQIEQAWTDWMLASGLAEKLHVMAQAKVTDGEGCAILQTNPAIKHPVKLDIVPIEADQLATPEMVNITNPMAVDGIVFDRYGNPTEYHVLKQHPGDLTLLGNDGFNRIPPEFFLHWHRKDRPGQARGVPEITSCLVLFAQLRRWTLAVLTGAETAANFAAILHTEGSPDTNPQADPWDEVDIQMGTMTTMPAGWKMDQFDAKQPAANYESFKRELLKEIARCLLMPYNVVSGDSSLYNYASGRLDWQLWGRGVRVVRTSFERTILEHIFRSWLEEASRVRGLLPAGISITSLPHGWFWDAVQQHVDPVKDGTGDQLALANNTDTLANLCAAQGLDWEEVLEQRHQEMERMKELGLPLPPDPATVAANARHLLHEEESRASLYHALAGRN